MELVEEIMSVRDAILLCIIHDIKGAQSQLDSYDNASPRPCLSTKNQIKALKGNLECIYENVKVTGGGERGKVILSGLKVDIEQKEDGRVENEGQPPSKEILLMTEYVYNQLYTKHVQDKYMDFSFGGWTKQLDFIDITDNFMKSFEGRIREVHTNTSFHIIKPSEVARYFKDAIYSMSTGVVKKSFNMLSRQGKIEYIEHFNVKKVGGKKERVEESEYDEISKARMDLLKEMKSSISEYNQAINSPNPSERAKKIVATVSEMLAKEFDCSFIYKSYEVISVVGESILDIEKDDFMEAYWNSFIKRSERRQRLYDNKPKEEQTWMWRKLWCYHTLIFIEYMGHDTGGLLLQYEMENPIRIRELSDAYQAWQDKDKPVGFVFNAEQIEEELVDFF